MAQSAALADLGWSDDFADDIAADERDLYHPYRIAEVQRATALGIDPKGQMALSFPAGLSSGDIAVGDWVLVDVELGRIHRALARRSVLSRRAAGHVAKSQLIAANVDTLFIVTSCNADFNIARLERYAAMAMDAGTVPVIVLTKSDLSDDPETFVTAARGISPKITVLALNALDAGELAQLRPWCGAGQTVALVGSSGVGKSTLINGLTGAVQSTGGIREDDARGRHTTTSRSLHPIAGGGWLIDMPGMRELGMHDASTGIDLLFSDLTTLASQCKFRDCAHDGEPGCAIGAAIARGELEMARLARWQKLKDEDTHNTVSVAEARRRGKAMAKTIKSAKHSKKHRRHD